MLNRRTLRIKAMQNIFALQTAKEAEYQISIQNVKDEFLPDLNSMEEQNKEQLAIDSKQAGEGFVLAIEQGFEKLNSDYSETIKDAIDNELSRYNNQMDNFNLTYKKRLITETKNIYNLYLGLLQIPLEIQDIVNSKDKKGKHSNLKSNKVLSILNSSEEYQNHVNRYGVSWTKDAETLQDWFKNVIKSDDVYKEYAQEASPNFEQDRAIVLYLFKSIIFKNETIASYFEEKDLGWSENSAVLKSMILKTIKGLEDEESDLVLMELSKNWDEDLLFLENIYDQTIRNESEYNSIVSERSKNWEIDRVALIDKIILQMAISEMINFPSIPVKVTINEYIELSKLYSTPKSKQFINGILDVLSEQLKKEGKIKKSGRGLIDNK